MTTGRRALQGLIAGVLAGAFTLWLGGRFPGTPRDFDQFWYAARAVVAGNNPYLLIGPGLDFSWPWPFVYPLVSVVIAMPLAWLPVLAARAVFVGSSVGLLAFAMPPRLLIPLLVSQPFVNALWISQWEPLLVAAMLLPWLGMVGVAKPTVGLALLAQSGTWRQAWMAVAGGLGLLAISLTIQPTWPADWLAAVSANPRYTAPVFRSGGVLLLLAALRWRNRDGRLLLMLALVPQTSLWYTALPLFLIPRTIGEATILAGLSQVAFLVTAMVPPTGNFDGQLSLIGDLMQVLLYLPALIVVLRQPHPELAAEAVRVSATDRSQ